jgi:hypothetical protein
MNCEEDQALLERAANLCAVLLVVLLVVAAPIGFLSGSVVVGTICGALLMVSGTGLAVLDWVVRG